MTDERTQLSPKFTARLPDRVPEMREKYADDELPALPESVAADRLGLVLAANDAGRRDVMRRVHLDAARVRREVVNRG